MEEKYDHAFDHRFQVGLKQHDDDGYFDMVPAENKLTES